MRLRPETVGGSGLPSLARRQSGFEPGRSGRTVDLQPGCVQQQRILILEDDERIGSSLVRALQGSGYDAS